ncbi:bacteriocin-protection protein [Anaerolineae bacterium CFX7]|nr:bacteriocin-protection protein [Anaerolineae bacterium CFX7]
MSPVFFQTQAALREWFLRHHADTTELFIGFYKKGAPQQGIAYPQALDEALCFGWIDGVRKSIDATRWMIRFIPRKPKSIWSAVNLKRAAELERAGMMQPAGLAAFHGHDKKRTRQYSFENRPQTLNAADEKKFRADKKAWTWFHAQAPSYQRAALWWVVSAKQDATRARRLDALIADSRAGVRVKSLRPYLGK